MAARRSAPPLRSALFLRRQAGDFVNVGAIDADIVQLAVAIGRELLQHAPINAAGAQESRDGERSHRRKPRVSPIRRSTDGRNRLSRARAGPNTSAGPSDRCHRSRPSAPEGPMWASGRSPAVLSQCQRRVSRSGRFFLRSKDVGLTAIRAMAPVKETVVFFTKDFWKGVRYFFVSSDNRAGVDLPSLWVGPAF